MNNDKHRIHLFLPARTRPLIEELARRISDEDADDVSMTRAVVRAIGEAIDRRRQDEYVARRRAKKAESANKGSQECPDSEE